MHLENNRTATVLWFRQDLRLHDNPALVKAAANGPVIPVYILDDVSAEQWKMGSASRWWLHHSLSALSARLKAHGLSLILRKGNPLEILPALLKESRASAIYWNRCYEPYAILRDTELKTSLQQQGVEVHSFNGSLLCEPWEVSTRQKSFFKVFTPFWKECQSHIAPVEPAPCPVLIKADMPLASESLASWKLLPEKPDWAGGLRANWKPGEQGAIERLEHFLKNGFATYADERDFPSLEVTSRLSPHLHFGEISPSTLWHAVHATALFESDRIASPQLKRFLDEIGWREFSYHVLFHFPQLPDTSYKAPFRHFPWNKDDALLACWQKGKTGYPIVDAGMRELWHTGFMHNRVRMITASFLTKDLLIPWQQGAAWFWDTLVDADLANNSASWQWVAGCGMDAAPYFRIFNPVTQGERFDPEGHYIRTWLPELAALPDKYIHAPWEAPAALLQKAGITLGLTYPSPIVDHAYARERAMKAYRTLK